MRLQHISEQIFNRPWLITASGHAAVRSLFESKLGRTFADDESDQTPDFPFVVKRDPPTLDANGIGRVSIKGVVGLGLSKIEKACGATDTKDVAAELLSLAEQGARGILLCIDSPGGMVTGTPELADAVCNINADIPVFVFTDGQLCSAAYWIASGATKVLATDSAEIGSIGVFYPWVDQSGAWEKMGLKSDVIVNADGIYKAAGVGPSLTDDQRASIQAKVERIFGLFKTFVTTMRRINGATVSDEVCQGQTFLGLDALSAGLVDKTVSCEMEAYDELLAELNEPDIEDDAEMDFEFPAD